MLHVYGSVSPTWAAPIMDVAEDELPPLLNSSSRGNATRALLDRVRSHHAPTAAHSVRVARVLMWMWSAAPERLGDPEPLLLGGALHDVGKLFIPADILDAGRALNAIERKLVQRHPETGAQVLENLGFPPLVVAAARGHHERWDGTGYPHGRRAEDLHVIARATAVADAYVAMVEPGRAYRTPLDRKAAFAEIATCRGTHFDPEISDILVSGITGRPSAAFEACAS